jgi:hypothetical protein
VGKLASCAEAVHGGLADRELEGDIGDRKQRLVWCGSPPLRFQQQASSKFSAIGCQLLGWLGSRTGQKLYLLAWLLMVANRCNGSPLLPKLNVAGSTPVSRSEKLIENGHFPSRRARLAFVQGRFHTTFTPRCTVPYGRAA